MFLPKSTDEIKQEDAAKEARNFAYKRIEQWSLDLVPDNIRDGVQISVQEVECGDPNCSPIDTAVAIMFTGGGSGMMGLPMYASEVVQEDIQEQFPPPEILEKWHNGQEADWPPLDMDDEMDLLPQLRFNVEQKVECRVGPDEVTGWVKGTITQLWYREKGWAEGSFAPYKVLLDDGREIFAPGDVDSVIRAQT